MPETNIYDLGYNSALVKEPLFSNTVQSANVFSSGVASTLLQSGDMAINAQLVSGHIQSSNFVSGSAGWQITADGDIEANSGNFRGDITAATGLFGGTIGFENVAAGTNANALNVGNAYVKIDGANKRITINDGTNDRVLLGYLAGKF